MRLECQYQAAFWIGAAGSGERSSHFHRMVAVVINHQGTAALRQLDFAVALETPSHAAETGQPTLDGFHVRAALQRHTDGSQRVEHIVPPRCVQPHFKRRD